MLCRSTYPHGKLPYFIIEGVMSPDLEADKIFLVNIATWLISIYTGSITSLLQWVLVVYYKVLHIGGFLANSYAQAFMDMYDFECFGNC